jgi:DNA-binding transcriptional MerR regulator
MGRKPSVIECLETVDVCRLAGVNRSTLDYWVRTGLVAPSLRTDPGRRRTRLWTVRDAVVVRTIAALRSSGCPLQQVRRARTQIENEWGGIRSDTALMWTGGDVVRIGPDGEIESLLRLPRQQVLRFVVLPLGSWQAEASKAVAYIRQDRVALGVPAPTRAKARNAI